MRIIVSGGRDYDKPEAVYHELHLLAEQRGWLTIIEGGCPTGVDMHARQWAQAHYHGLVTVRAKWNLHGRGAGPIRNSTMALACKPDMLLTFPGGRGTKDMRRAAADAGVFIQYAARETGK